MRHLPPPILNKMRGLIRRVRRVALCKGVLAVAATALFCLLAIMAVDAAVTIFSPALRWALTLTGFAVTGAAAWWWVIRPASKQITLASIARFVEQRHPELQETLSSAIELLTSDDPDDIRGSRELIGEVVKSAEREAARVSPSREIDAAAIRKSALAALSLAGVLGMIYAFWPSPATRLMLRAVAPFLEVGNAYADTLVVEPGDRRVAKGADLTIKASVRHPRLNKATVRRVDAGSKVEGVERMNYQATEGDRREFTMTFPNVTKDFTYRVHAGNAVSRFYQVTAVEPPKVEKLQVRITPPLYTGQAPSTVDWKGDEVVVPEYAEAAFQAKLNRDAGESKFFVGEKEIPLEDPVQAGVRSWIVSVTKEMKADWRIELKDAEGFANDPARGAIRATADAVPTVRITSPESRELRLRPGEILPLRYVATEDYGFARAELVQEMDSWPEPKVESLELPARSGQEWQGQTTLDLAPLQLVPGQVLRVRLRLADNLPIHLKGPQIGESETLVIRIDAGVKSLVEQVVQSQQQEIQQSLNEVRQDLRQARSSNEQLRREMQNQSLTPRAMERLTETQREVAEAEDRLEKLAAKMEPTLFREPARKMAEIAAKQIQPAREQVEMIALSDSREARLTSSTEVGKKLDEALKQIDQMAGELGKANEMARQVAELSDLAKKQQDLAEDVAEEARQAAAREAMAAQTPQAAAQAAQENERQMREWQRQQQQVQNKLAEMLKQSPEALGQVLQEQQERAAKIAQQSDDLAKEQAKLKEATARLTDPKAAQALRAEMMKQLQTAQQEIAGEAGDLRKQMTRDEAQAAPQFDKLLDEAAKTASEAAKQLQKTNIEPATQAATGSLQALQKAAQASSKAVADQNTREDARTIMELALPKETSSTPELRQAIQSAAEAIANEAAKAPPGALVPQKVREAVEQASQNLRDPAQANPAAVAEAAKRATAAVQAMQAGADRPPQGAQGTPPPAPPDPAKAQKLSELSERQAGVTQALDAMRRGQTEEAMAAMQKTISQQALDLLAQSEAMERSASLTRQQQAQSWADQAGRQFQAAMSQAQAASEQLKDGQAMQDQAQAAAAKAANPSLSPEEAMAQAKSGKQAAAPVSPGEQQKVEQARQSQQRAQEALTQASQKLAQSGQTLAQAAKNAQAEAAKNKANATAKAAPSAPVDAKNLAQSYQQTAQASEAQNASQAASMAGQAAQSLSQMARQAVQSMGTLNDPSSGKPAAPTDGRATDEAGVTPASRGAEMKPGENVLGDGIPPELAKLGISAADWARIKSSLGSETTNQGSSGAPKEYRDLVSDYFRIIATEAKK